MLFLSVVCLSDVPLILGFGIDKKGGLLVAFFCVCMVFH